MWENPDSLDLLKREDDTLDICAAGYWSVCGLEHYYSLSFLTIYKVAREDINSQL